MSTAAMRRIADPALQGRPERSAGPYPKAGNASGMRHATKATYFAAKRFASADPFRQ